MNKKLLAAAVAAAFVAPMAASADAVLYGKIHTSVDAIDNGAQDNWEMNSRASRLGVKGSEDLGNGLKAIWQIEVQVAADGNETADGQDGSGTGFDGQRNTFIGLSGDWGTALVGRHDTPNKFGFYGSGIETLGDSILDPNNGVVGVFGASDYRADNAIAYISPNFSGFTVAAAVIPGEDGAPGASAGDGIADHYSFGARYAGGGLKVGGGYESKTDGVEDEEIMQIGASYNFDIFTVAGHYEAVDNLGWVAGSDQESFAFSGKVKLGNNTLHAIYSDTDGGDGEGFDAWGVGADHAFSKRTKVYAAYASRDYSGATSDDDQFSIGMIHSF
jgi:predicted porin